MSYPMPPQYPQGGQPPRKKSKKRRGSRPPQAPGYAPYPGAYPPTNPQTPGYGMQPVQAQQQKPPARRRRRGRRGCAVGPGLILGCMGIIGVMVLSFLITAWLVYDHYVGQLEDKIDSLDQIGNQSFETTVIYDREGSKLDEVFSEGRRTRISIAQMPQYLIDATISIEDDTFYENRGIDIPGILRAAKDYLQEGYVVSGGSTITQQLIRNVLFDYEYRTEISLQRKAEEALLAVILTQRMSKDEILELYLNEIYYGNLAYGIEAASQTYFDKHAADLTLGEAALLAGLPQAPADLDPLNPDPDVQRRVMERRRLVLNRMVDEDYITESEADAAYAEPLTYASPDVRLESAPHFIVYATAEVENLLVRELGLPQEEIRRMVSGGGLRVYTTIDMDYQRIAEEAVRQQVASLSASNHMTNGAAVIVQPETGEILAMVGSVDYGDESIDGNVNVTIAARQPGSAMKPFNYASALEKGWTAAQVIWDTEVEIDSPGAAPYKPVNYDGSYHGPVRIREALANSYNIPAVQTLRYVGVDYLLWMMNRVGVTSLSNDPSQYGLSLTLGGGEVTPLELTTAYAVLANGGVYVPNTPILCVTTSDDEILYEYEQGCPDSAHLTSSSVSVNATGRQVMDERIAFVISDILADNTARTPAMGSSSPLYTPNIPTSAKTGTTNDFRDNWTVGYTRNLAVGVWTGNTDNTEMINVSGLQGAAPIWNAIMTGIYNNSSLLDALGSRPADDAHLQPPAGVSHRQICNLAALKDPATTCTPGREEWFLDSPAAVPDSNGNLVPGQATPAPQTSANGPQPVEVEPGVIRVAVMPVSSDIANAVAALDTSGHTVPPRYCQVPVEVATMVSGVQEQYFIAPPPVEEDAFYARRWAQAAGIAILPQFACNEQMLQAGPAVAGNPNVVAQIMSPAPGTVLTTGQQLDIVGTAHFTSDQATHYMVQIKGGPWSDYVTVHEGHYSSVDGGLLEQIPPGGLQPGDYVLRVIVVGTDGNYAQVSNEVTIHVDA
ncbi:MAG TPA: PBP1A family penicillin-binding protein [Aggregatilinea sp.]|uniref:PBP1A family penicillin-binding protein n=1 Tax=Aggregatilinea sp. TaxID=2806333 RepID=UPI002D0B9751|nr:PBP1A family penicillin-binding protein [Aggregatilinea sp.]HML22742.1 PBP1A family penicillin-binding protein [Aggregatilinea sp.]